MNNANPYLIAFINSFDDVQPLDTGLRYSRAQAERRAAEMNRRCDAELKALGGKAFVSFNTAAL
jgi:hypothetical protein